MGLLIAMPHSACTGGSCRYQDFTTFKHIRSMYDLKRSSRRTRQTYIRLKTTLRRNISSSRLYYSFYNPTSSDIRYEFNIDIEDQNGNIFAGENFLVAETVPANSNLHGRYKEFAIYRNSTNYYFVWHDKQVDSPWLDTTPDCQYYVPCADT